MLAKLVCVLTTTKSRAKILVTPHPSPPVALSVALSYAKVMLFIHCLTFLPLVCTVPHIVQCKHDL